MHNMLLTHTAYRAMSQHILLELLLCRAAVPMAEWTWIEIQQFLSKGQFQSWLIRDSGIKSMSGLNCGPEACPNDELYMYMYTGTWHGTFHK